MEILKCIKTRQSVRAFTSKRIPKSVMKRILQAASNCPSYTNTQPWEVAVVSGKKRDELQEILLNLAKEKAPTKSDIPKPKGWPAGLDERAREHGARRLSTLGIARDDTAGRERLSLMNLEFYGAPCAVFLFIDSSLGEYSIYDVGLFTQNLILAAHSFNIESCIQASVTNYAREIKKFFGISENSKKLVICISMGYADSKAILNTYKSSKQKPDGFTRWYD
jgi:nitroreductase